MRDIINQLSEVESAAASLSEVTNSARAFDLL